MYNEWDKIALELLAGQQVSTEVSESEAEAMCVFYMATECHSEADLRQPRANR